MKNLAKVATLAFLSVAVAAQSTRTFTGVITDSMCVLNHGMMKIQPESKCVIQCVKTSKNVKYALHDGRNTYVLSDQQTPEKFAAQKVKVKGVLYEKTRIIKVDSIEADR